MSKAIDKAAGGTREVVGKSARHIAAGDAAASNLYAQDEWTRANGRMGEFITAPATEDAARWEGWGTALKPAHEPIIVARKPLTGTVAANVLEWGTGGLNIGGCRVEHASEADRAESEGKNRHADFDSGPRLHNGVYQGQPAADRAQYDGSAGRWPPNLLLTHSADCQPAGTRRVKGSRIDKLAAALPGDRSAYGTGLNGARPARGIGDADGMETVEAWDCVTDGSCPVAGLDEQSGNVKGAVSNGRLAGTGFHGNFGAQEQAPSYADAGGASRFFPQFTWSESDFPFMYCAKAPQKERPKVDGIAHPTTKPLTLMRWLVRLVTPPGGIILDPFAGTGTTGEAARLEGFGYVLIEREPDYIKLINARMERFQPSLFDEEDCG